MAIPKQLLWGNLVTTFQTREISVDELEAILGDAIVRECHGASVEKFKYTEDGIEAILDNGSIVEIEIDWNEIILT